MSEGEEEQELTIERGPRIGVLGGTKAIRSASTFATPLTPEETAFYEKFLGKPGAYGPPVPVPGEGLATLVVEDDPHTRSLIVGVLAKVKCRPVEVADGSNALKALVKYKVDLVILDLRLPVVDGFAVIRGARSYLKVLDVPILVVTALSDKKDEASVMNLGADGYICKPFDLKQLEAHLNAHLRRARSRAAG